MEAGYLWQGKLGGNYYSLALHSDRELVPCQRAASLIAKSPAINHK